MHVYFRQSFSLRFYQSLETNIAGNKRACTFIWHIRVLDQVLAGCYKCQINYINITYVKTL
jgi:hypothetical protein